MNGSVCLDRHRIGVAGVGEPKIRENVWPYKRDRLLCVTHRPNATFSQFVLCGHLAHTKHSRARECAKKVER